MTQWCSSCERPGESCSITLSLLLEMNDPFLILCCNRGTPSCTSCKDYFYNDGRSSWIIVQLYNLGSGFRYVHIFFSLLLSSSQSSRLSSTSLLSPISAFKITRAARICRLKTRLTFSSDAVLHAHDPYSIFWLDQRIEKQFALCER